MLSMFRAYSAFVSENQALLMSVVFVLSLASAAFFIRASLRLQNLRRMYRSVLGHRELADLEEYLARQFEGQKALSERVTALERDLLATRRQADAHIQRWALERYKAFKDVGGDQSFSLALLDAKNNGFVLTSIYGRDESRIFGKCVAEGEAVHPLSAEERKVLRAAMEETGVKKKENPTSAAK